MEGGWTLEASDGALSLAGDGSETSRPDVGRT